MIVCPKCRGATSVVDTRLRDNGARGRRRECRECGARFTTLEQIEERSHIVKRRALRPVEFVRSKLRRSLELACAKTGVTNVDALAERIAAPIEASEVDVTTATIRELVLAELETFCPVGYVRYRLAGKYTADLSDVVTALVPFMDVGGATDTEDVCKNS